MSAISPLAQVNYLEAAPQRRLTRLSGTWGVEVRGFDLEAPLTESLAECLRSLLSEHQLLFFRRCHLSESRLMELAGLFGQPEVSADPQRAAFGQSARMPARASDRSYYRLLWQADGSYRARPYAVALVHCPGNAPDSPEPSFLSSALLAYETVSDGIRQRVEKMTAMHCADGSMRWMVDSDGTPGARDEDGAEHPVVMRHPFTGRSYLNVNEAYTHRLTGVPAVEGERLLALLTQQFYRPEHQVKLKWRPGSLAIWDPRTVQHYGPAQGDGSRRLVRVSGRL